MSEFWCDRLVLVTGCRRFLGNWLVAELLERGALVTGLVRDLVPHLTLCWRVVSAN